jgi:N-acetyl-1-D-myo-inositol-2-amino-2-deoxy-alpha-D-glucopyranoside deacetylase
MTALRQTSVLAVYAHPDDELFHGGAYLSQLSDRGARVTVACATRGEAGKAHPSVGAVTDLAALRTEELRQSCAALGLGEPRFLGFHDSARKERQRHDDPRALANVDMLEVEAAILAVIDDVTPHVIVTFDPHGGYYHPDHVAVHRATTAAFFSSGVTGDVAPARLFYSTFSIGAYREHAARTKGWGVVDGLDPEVFGITPGTAALVFDARPYMDRKLAALAAHRSAFGVAMEKLDGFRPILEEEVFTLGGTRAAVPHWPLRDFFDGLPFNTAPSAP